MREILFKAKRRDNGEWVEGLPRYALNGNMVELEVYKGAWDCRLYEIDPDTLCQYIGLTDINGNKIWENDLCYMSKENVYKTDCLLTVKWSVEEAKFVLDRSVLTTDFHPVNTTCYDNDLYVYECEVVGNIFDNPDLLEVE